MIFYSSDEQNAPIESFLAHYNKHCKKLVKKRNICIKFRHKFSEIEANGPLVGTAVQMRKIVSGMGGNSGGRIDKNHSEPLKSANIIHFWHSLMIYGMKYVKNYYHFDFSKYRVK